MSAPQEQPKQGSSIKRPPDWFDLDDSRNTYVYVSGLPTTVTEEEFVDLMKVAGIIAKKPTQGAPWNIKLYRDKNQNPKGDALCCYVKKESVGLALELIDGRQYDDQHTIRCERAKFELKGSYDPAKKPRPLDKKAKLKQRKTLDKLLSWEEKNKSEPKQFKVILKNMFTPEEILEDATLIIELKDDVELKCSELEPKLIPKKIEVFDRHPEGVIGVTFADEHEAERCLASLNGELYAGRIVEAQIWDGKTKYNIKETDEEAQQRLDKWHKDLES